MPRYVTQEHHHHKPLCQAGSFPLHSGPSALPRTPGEPPAIDYGHLFHEGVHQKPSMWLHRDPALSFPEKYLCGKSFGKSNPKCSGINSVRLTAVAQPGEGRNFL